MDMPFSEGAFQRHLNTIAANRQGYNSGFRPGTQTLDSRRFDEEKRKNEADALRQAMEFKEKKRQFDLTYNLNKQNAALDLASPASKPTSVKPGNNELFAETIDSMLQGQDKHRKALIGGENRNPHNYNSYVTDAIKLSRMAGQPLSGSEIKELMERADKLGTADTIWQENLPLQNEKEKPWWKLW
jgi:hypothetical protein